MSLSNEQYSNLQNLLALNPRVQTKGTLVPSSVTKENKKHWKRNADKSCQVILIVIFCDIFLSTLRTNKIWCNVTYT